MGTLPAEVTVSDYGLDLLRAGTAPRPRITISRVVNRVDWQSPELTPRLSNPLRCGTDLLGRAEESPDIEW